MKEKLRSYAQNANKYVNRVSISFLYCMYLMLLSGSYYAFSSYAKEMSSKLGYTQTQVNVLSSISAIFGNTSAMLGFILDKFSFRISIIFAGLLVLLGYVLVGLAYQMIINYHYLLMTIYIGLVNLGNMGAYLTALKINNANVTKYLEGVTNGILVALYGLSATMISAIYVRIGSVDKFMYAMGTIAGGSFMLGSLIMYTIPKKSADKMDDEENSYVSSLPGLFSTESFLSKHVIIFILYTGTAPAAILTVLSTVWSQVESYQYDKFLSTYIVVITFSIFSCIGRFVSGLLVSIYTKHIYFATLGIFASSIALILFIFQTFIENYIFFMTLVVGLGFVYGVILTSIPICVRNYFGFKNFGIYLSLSLFPLSVVSLVYSLISGLIYDSFGKDAVTQKCVGRVCYLYTYIILAIFTMLGLFINIWFFLQEKALANKELLSTPLECSSE